MRCISQRRLRPRCRWLHEQGAATHVSFGPPLGPDPLAAVDTLGRQVLPRLNA
jgi:5,10-methylenetetrahydromethanopterin reductase